MSDTVKLKADGTPVREGREDEVKVQKVVQALHRRLPDKRRLPPFFYLASCHGNDPTAPDQPGAASAAVQLHRAGVTEVVGYFGPVVDALSTRAEEALYGALAGQKARRGVFITTSGFTAQAIDFARSVRPGAGRW
mgnify:CR=1 FL=1